MDPKSNEKGPYEERHREETTGPQVHRLEAAAAAAKSLQSCPPL